MSKLWLEKIVQVSGLIDLLEKGDHLMVDRGLNIRDLFTRRGVKLNIPPFSKGRFSNSTYHTNKKAKEELSLFSNPGPLFPPPPKHKPLPCLHFQQQMGSITCCTFLSYCHFLISYIQVFCCCCFTGKQLSRKAKATTSSIGKVRVTR